jgi:nitrous oxide reductase accessory protein NosL
LLQKFPAPLPTNIIVKNSSPIGTVINFTDENVKEAIMSSKAGKAVGFDAIKNEYLKDASNKQNA